MLGIASPEFHDLGKYEFKADMPSAGNIILDNETNIRVDFMLVNDLPRISYGTLAGAEISTQLDDRNDVIFGLSSWEGGSGSRVRVKIPFQGVMSDTAFERTGNISYTQYSLGWRHYYMNNNAAWRWSYKLAVHEIFDIDFKERMVFAFASGPAAGFKRVVVMESQGAGMMAIEAGLGAEKSMNRWLSFGMDAGYLQGVRRVVLNNGTMKTNFQEEASGSDYLQIKLPAQLGPDGSLGYLVSGTDVYKKMRMNVDGWQIVFKVNFHY
ncbi:MAG: hypothetical protein HY940_03650 [Gammaproteobacteria bacterium]|nr:hypothetical protein [Gammaproteobacteria bacterium]